MARKLSDAGRANVAAYVECVKRGECNMREAAKASGSSYATMWRHCRDAGIVSDGRLESSLTDEQKRHVIKMKQAGASNRTIAMAIGCGLTAIRNAIRRYGDGHDRART